jgi:hypothetical protein
MKGGHGAAQANSDYFPKCLFREVIWGMTMDRVDAARLRELLDPLDAAPVECDGMTRLACTVLSKEGIAHRVLVGSLTFGDQTVVPHFWIEVGEYLIDYRARMWLGQSDAVPHGVCEKHALCTRYSGEQIDMQPLSEELFSILVMPWPVEAMCYTESAGNKTPKIKGMR